MSFVWTDVGIGKTADPNLMNALGRTVAQHDQVITAYAPKLYKIVGATYSRIGTTLTDDTYLQFTDLPPNATYEVRSQILYRSSVTARFKHGWSCSGVGASFTWTMAGLASNQTSNVGSIYAGSNSLAGTEAAGGQDPFVDSVMRPGGILRTGTGTGITFRFRWAQNTNDAVYGTTMVQDSYVILERLS